MDAAAIKALKFDEKGLIPAILQDWRDGTVLMVAYMNREALEKDRKSTRLNSSHIQKSRMPSSA